MRRVYCHAHAHGPVLRLTAQRLTLTARGRLLNTLLRQHIYEIFGANVDWLVCVVATNQKALFNAKVCNVGACVCLNSIE